MNSAVIVSCVLISTLLLTSFCAGHERRGSDERRGSHENHGHGHHHGHHHHHREYENEGEGNGYGYGQYSSTDGIYRARDGGVPSGGGVQMSGDGTDGQVSGPVPPNGDGLGGPSGDAGTVPVPTEGQLPAGGTGPPGNDGFRSR